MSDYQVVYWWENRQFSLVSMRNQRIFDGQNIVADLTIDMTLHPARHYVGLEGWFSAEFVDTHNGIVPDCADHGSAPGQWLHIEEALVFLRDSK